MRPNLFKRNKFALISYSINVNYFVFLCMSCILKVGLGLFFACLLHLGFSQNYADSGIYILDAYPILDASSYQEEVLKNARQTFLSLAPDSQLMYTMMEVTVSTSALEVGKQMNELLGRFCKHRLGEPLPTAQANVFKGYLAGYYNLLASDLIGNDLFQEGLAKRYEALELCREIGDTAYMTEIMIDLSSTYSNMSEIEEAAKWVQQAMELEKARNNQNGLNKLKVSLAKCMVHKGAYKEAIPLFQEGLKWAISQNELPFQAEAYQGLGNSYRKLKDFDQAISHFNSCLAIFEQVQFTFGISIIHNQLSNTAIDKGDWQLAKHHANQALELAEVSKSLQIRANAAEVLAQVYQQEGKYEKSIEMLKLYYALKDSLTGKANTKALLDQKYKLEYEQKAAIDSIQYAASLTVEKTENKRRKNLVVCQS